MSRDSLLIGLSAAAILLAWWPVTTDLVPITVSRGSQVQRYTLAADAPQMTKLRKLAQPPTIRVDADLALARWRYETTSFYAAADAKQASERGVFKMIAHPIGTTEVRRTTEQAVYWNRSAVSAKRQLDAIEARTAQLRNLRTVRIGEPMRGPLPAAAFVVATGVAILVAILFATWKRLAPPLRLELAASKSETAVHSVALRVVVPKAWVRVSQPGTVQVRRFAGAAIVIVAVISIVI